MSMQSDAQNILKALGQAETGERPDPPDFEKLPEVAHAKARAAYEQALSDHLMATNPANWSQQDRLFIAQQTLLGLQDGGFCR